MKQYFSFFALISSTFNKGGLLIVHVYATPTTVVILHDSIGLI